MKKTRRTSRVGEMIRDALVEVFRHDLKDIDLGLTSITEVEISPDLNFARVYMSGLKEDEAREKVEQLQEVRGRIRHSLGKRIRLRYTPELDFKYDETSMRATRIESLLLEVMPKEMPQETLATGDDDNERNDDSSDDES